MGTVLLVVGASSAWAGPDYIIKQRAKELSNENNVRQGVAPPTQASQPPPGVPQPAAPTLSPGLVKFRADLAELPAGSSASVDQKQKLAQELVASAQGGKPSLAAASRFVENVSAALAEKQLPAASRARLAQELDAVLNPGKYPQARLDGIFNDIQAIFQENGASRTRAVAIADSVRAMSGEVQQGGAKP